MSIQFGLVERFWDMGSFDAATVMDWVISGLIGLAFGIISAWVTHRYQKERDSIAWEREKEKLRQQFEHEKRLLQIQFQQRLIESEQKSAEQQSNQVKDELLRGVDNPNKTLNELLLAEQRIKGPHAAAHSDAYLRKYIIIAMICWVSLPIVIGIVVIIYLATR